MSLDTWASAWVVDWRLLYSSRSEMTQNGKGGLSPTRERGISIHAQSWPVSLACASGLLCVTMPRDEYMPQRLTERMQVYSTQTGRRGGTL